VAGGCTEFAPEPLFPAEKTMNMPWLPAAGTAEPAGCASRTRASYRCESTV
jgi:hypothetical protein